VCSNYLPDQWWGEKTKFDRDAVFRRFTVVHWHKKVMEDPEIFESDVPLQLEGCAMNKFMAAYRVVNPIFVAPIGHPNHPDYNK